MQTEKEKASRERRSTIFRSYSRVLCNCRPMHLAGQSFMAEARTRKNVCFNSVLLPSPTPVYLLASVAALNYSECANICKIRSSAFSIRYRLLLHCLFESNRRTHLSGDGKRVHSRKTDYSRFYPLRLSNRLSLDTVGRKKFRYTIYQLDLCALHFVSFSSFDTYPRPYFHFSNQAPLMRYCDK